MGVRVGGFGLGSVSCEERPPMEFSLQTPWFLPSRFGPRGAAALADGGDYVALLLWVLPGGSNLVKHWLQPSLCCGGDVP